MNRLYIIIVLSALGLYYGCSASNSTLNTHFQNTVDSLAVRPVRLATLSYLFRRSYGSWPNSLQECYYLWGDSISSLLAGQDTSYITIQFTPLNQDSLKIQFSMVPFSIASTEFRRFSGTIYVVPTDSMHIVVADGSLSWMSVHHADLSLGINIRVNSGQLVFPLDSLNALKVRCFKRGANG